MEKSAFLTCAWCTTPIDHKDCQSVYVDTTHAKCYHDMCYKKQVKDRKARTEVFLDAVSMKALSTEKQKLIRSTFRCLYEYAERMKQQGYKRFTFYPFTDSLLPFVVHVQQQPQPKWVNTIFDIPSHWWTMGYIVHKVTWTPEVVNRSLVVQRLKKIQGVCIVDAKEPDHLYTYTEHRSPAGGVEFDEDRLRTFANLSTKFMHETMNESLVFDVQKITVDLITYRSWCQVYPLSKTKLLSIGVQIAVHPSNETLFIRHTGHDEFIVETNCIPGTPRPFETNSIETLIKLTGSKNMQKWAILS